MRCALFGLRPFKMNLFQVATLTLVLLYASCCNASSCSANLVETIPLDLTYNESIISQPTHEALLELINEANSTIDIASFYWTLQGRDVMTNPVPESRTGEAILDALINAAKRSVVVRIAVNDDNNSEQSEDLKLLRPHSQIRFVNFTRLVGAGILHTKFLIVDQQHFYLGSANMDWRSLTHVKEMGITFQCPTLAQDLSKIFETYWYLGTSGATVPKSWPSVYSAIYSQSHPLRSVVNGNDSYDIFLTSSPRELCASERVNDIDAILHIINSAQRFVYIAVMDYYPLFLYTKPTAYWPVIDDALRRAAVERRVEVRLLASHWNSTRRSMPLFLKSLEALRNTDALKGSIETKLFTVPIFTPTEGKIPFARVNHNKYMVTDQTAYIGTSNWSADYFVNTGGVGLILNQTTTDHSALHAQLKSIFLRDWNSNYAKEVL